MNPSRSFSRKVFIFSVSLVALFGVAPSFGDDLPPPPPPEAADAGLTSLDDASAGAELPPPPVPGAVEPPTTSAEAAPPPPAEGIDPTSVENPPAEEIPALPLQSDEANNNEVPEDSGLADVPAEEPPASVAPERSSSAMASSSGSSTENLQGVSMSDRIKTKDLVLWLSLGPSYGTLSPKGIYTTAISDVGATSAVNSVNGLGYNAGIGFMLDDLFQLQFDFTGTPRTKGSTVDNAMFGFGPRLGVLSFMGVFGVQQGPNPAAANGLDNLFAIGARAGLDLVLKHSKDSRVSIGLSPEVYYITPQGADGYDSVGASVSLRIYGYDTAF